MDHCYTRTSNATGTLTKRLMARLTAVGLLLLLGINAANAQSCVSPASVGSEAELNAAIACYNAAGSGTFVLNLTQAFTLTAGTTAIANSAGATLELSGNGQSIDGAGTYRIFELTAGTMSIDRLTLQNGVADTAPCNNHLCGGAILTAADTVLSVSSSTFSGNQAPDGGGGAILNQGELTMSNSTFTLNSARYGGAIYNYKSKATLVATTTPFSANAAPGRLGTGGAIFHDEGALTLNNVTVTANSAGLGRRDLR